MDSLLISSLLALSAAVSWGAGDFTGGVSARRVGPFHAVLIPFMIGAFVLITVALISLEPFPSGMDLIWGALAGVLGMLGLGYLLRGFAAGRMGIVAPVSAVLATSIPVIFSMFTEGLPRELQLLGFGLALVGIWLLSRPEKFGGRPAGLGLALLAGLGFGAFFTALDQVGENVVFWPLVAGRLAACLVLIGFGLITRKPLIPQRAPYGLLMLAGVLDVLGNLFFLLAVQTGRLDIAAVLGSLYPAMTALLALVVAKEPMARMQVIGVTVAVLAIVLITL